MHSRWLGIMLVGCVLLVLGNTALWVDRQIADETRFVSTTRDVLDERDVQRAVATRIVNRLLAEQPLLRALIGGRTEALVTLILASPAFEPVQDIIARQLHGMMIAGDYPTITIPAQNAEALSDVITTFVPGTSGVITGRPGALEIELFTRRDIPSFERHVSIARTAGFAGGLVGMVLFVVSIAATGNRPHMVIAAGVGLVAVAALSLALLVPLRTWLHGRIPDQAGRTIVESILSAMTGSMLVQSAIILVIGIALALVGFILRPNSTARSAGQIDPPSHTS